MDQQFQHTPTPTPQKSYKGMAAASLVCGILAMTLPVPVIDVILGVIGLVLAIKSRQHDGGGLATAGLVCSIIGTIWAVSFTMTMLFFPWDSFFNSFNMFF
ncbi:MAG: DUF4190 domain-containing protein [Oscillospiraceae bacterium]|nr:DUF4190 domain-containing protein [Oscillospiraceae bacterium]